jgi:hypothetical protein
MNSPPRAACAVLVAVVAQAATAEPVVIALGGPREAVVAIDDDGRDYRLQVTMRAVASFDARSDREANRSLARGFATAALARHLGCGDHQELALTGLTAGGESLADDRFSLPFSLPKASAKVVDKPSPFDKVRLDPEFAGYLLAEPLLMEVDGAKLIRLDDGRVLVLGIASAKLAGVSALDRKKAETVARNRALAHVVAEKTGVQVARAETVEKRTRVVLDAERGESASSVADYLETTSAKVQGLTRDFPVVGRWQSLDGTLLSVAVGGFLDPPAADPR